LRCLERLSNEDVPGCTGATASRNGIDFCYDPRADKNNADPEIVQNEDPIPVSAPQAPPTPFLTSVPAPEFKGSTELADIADENERDKFPLGRCEGDCDSDRDCADGMECYQRATDSKMVPGCLGDATDRTDYCIDPADNPSNMNSDTWRIKLFWREGYYWQEERRYVNFGRFDCFYRETNLTPFLINVKFASILQ